MLRTSKVPRRSWQVYFGGNLANEGWLSLFAPTQMRIEETMFVLLFQHGERTSKRSPLETRDENHGQSESSPSCFLERSLTFSADRRFMLPW